MTNKLKIGIAALGLIVVCPLASCGEPQQGVVEQAVATVTLVANDGGQANYAKGEYKVGDKIHIKAEPDKGYSLAYVKVNGERIRPNRGEYIYEITSNEVNIEVFFEKNQVLFADFTFELNDENNTATILKYNPDKNIVPYPFIVPETYEVNGKTYVIDKINKMAFSTSSIEAIVISKNITDIALETFSIVYALSSITVDPDNKVYSSYDDCLYSKDGTTLIAVPTEYHKSEFSPKAGTKIVGQSALQNTRKIESVNLPDSVTELNEKCFMAMSSLIHVTFSKNIKIVPKEAFSNDNSLQRINITEGIEEIGEKAFYFCADLETVTFPSSLRTIGIEAFYRCQKLSNPKLNDGLETIKKSAFGSCISITEMIMPDSLRRLETSVFESCFNLRSCVLNNGLEYLGGAAFILTYSLSQLVIPNTVTEIEYNPFIGAGLAVLKLQDGSANFTMVDGLLYSKDMTKLICVPHSFETKDNIFNIPNSVVEIGYNAFSMNAYLKKVIIPTSVKKMICAFQEILPNPTTHEYEMEIEYLGSIPQFNAIDFGGIIWNYLANFKFNRIVCNDGNIELQPQLNKD